MKTKATAQKATNRLVKRLGHGWKPYVWENLGWHYKAVSLDERFKIKTCGDGQFFSFLSLEPGPGGDARLTDSYHSKNPLKVVRHQIELLNNEIGKLGAVRQSMRTELGL